MVDHKRLSPAGATERPELCPSAPVVLRPVTTYWLTAAILFVVFARLAVSEGGPATVLLATLICATTGALAVVVSRRILIAAMLMLGQVIVVTVASELKLRHMNMVAHAYDIAFYLTSWSTLTFLWESYRLEAGMALLSLAISTAACIAAYRIDPVRVDRRTASYAFLLCATAASTTAATASERRHSQFEYEGMYLNSFYRSWAETIETLWRGQLIEAAQIAEGPTLTPMTTCTPAAKPPHVILIHQESVVPPGLFPTLDYNRQLDDFFKSDDGKTRTLRVETYGGASVLTEFSVMTGLSTYSFGGMRLFAQRLMSGKVKETVPSLLKTCGYRTTLFYPMLKSFTAADKFFAGAGIEEIFDLKDQGAKKVNERDRFYYANALDVIDNHVKTSDKPIFTFIETMFTHWPYHKTYEPEAKVPGGGPCTHPEMHEYLRRVWLARDDYQWMVGELERRFPGEQFLIVRYGDHHPMSTRVLLGYGEGTEAEDVLLDRNSVGFKTFYAVNGVRFTPQPFATPDVLDAAYLGTVMLEAAGLPLSDATKRRRTLKLACNGKMADCPKRDLVLNFNRALLNAGLVSPR